MPLMMSDYYAPQIQAGQLQEQQDVHQVRLAEIARMNREAENQQANKEAAQRIFGDTGVTPPPSGPTAQPLNDQQEFLSQVSQQTALANKQETMGKFLATTGQLKASEEAFKAARDTRKAAEDLVIKQQTEQKKKADQLGSILGPALDGNDQESYDIAREELRKVNPQFAAQLPAQWNPSTAKLVGQLSSQAMDRSKQIDLALKQQKDVELQEYRKERLNEQRESRLDRNANSAANRELRLMLHKQGEGAKKDSYTKDRNAYDAETTNLYKNVQKDIAKINQQIRTKLVTADEGKAAIDELREDYHRNMEATADKYRARGVNIPQLYKTPKAAPVGPVGKATETKPTGVSDKEWAEYQAYIKGAK